MWRDSYTQNCVIVKHKNVPRDCGQSARAVVLMHLKNTIYFSFVNTERR